MSQGTAPSVALAEAVGPLAALEGPFRGYIERSIYTVRRIRATYALRNLRRVDEALVEARAAVALAATNDERQDAQRVLDALTRAKSGW